MGFERKLELSNMKLETVILEDVVNANDLNKIMLTSKFKNPWPNLEKLFCFYSSTKQKLELECRLCVLKPSAF